MTAFYFLQTYAKAVFLFDSWRLGSFAGTRRAEKNGAGGALVIAVRKGSL